MKSSTTEMENPEGYPDSYLLELVREAERVREIVLKPLGAYARKILIIGGGGYIGTVLSVSLVERGFEVRNLDNLTYNHGLATVPLLSNPAYEFVYGNLCDQEIAIVSCASQHEGHDDRYTKTIVILR